MITSATRTAASAFAGLFFLFFITSSGGFESGDAVTRYETAKSWLNGNGGALPPGIELNAAAPGLGGKTYGVYGPMQSLLFVPLLAAARRLPVSDDLKEGAVRLTFSLIVLPLISALALCLTFAALVILGHSPRTALKTILVLALATPLWHYARTAQEENMVALGLASWLLGVVLFAKGRRGGLLLAATGSCFALATRWASAAPLIPLLVASVLLLMKQSRLIRWRELALAGAVCGLTVAGLLAFNLIRFGSLFETGYGLVMGPNKGLLSPQFFARATALLFSPYRGLFLYAPVFVVLVIGAVKERKRLSGFGKAGLAAFAAAFVLNAAYTIWSAGDSWGPRFLVAPIVLLAPVGVLIFQNPLKGWAKAFVALSVAIQFLSVLLPSSTEEIMRRKLGLDVLEPATAWICPASPVCERPSLAWTATVNSLAGRGVETASEFETLFWWPFRFAFRLGYFSPGVAIAVTALFALISAGFLAQAWKASASESLAGVPRKVS